MTAEALVHRRVIQPLGLRCTGYAPKTLPCDANRAHGHAGDQPKFIPRGNPTPDWQFTDLIRASAGLHSNARDLLIVAAAHLQQPRTRLNAVLADNTRVRVHRAGKTDAAIAWIADTIDGRTITYQIGLVAGFTSYIGLDIASGTVAMMFYPYQSLMPLMQKGP